MKENEIKCVDLFTSITIIVAVQISLYEYILPLLLLLLSKSHYMSHVHDNNVRFVFWIC